MQPALYAEDRSLTVPAGHIVHTGYVQIHKARMANRERMCPAAVERAYRKQLQLGDAQAFPPPNGAWEGETFVIYDGRHQFIAAQIAGLEWLLVAWVEMPEQDRPV